MTAFFERISECPRVFDAARGEDVLATLAESLAADEVLAPAGKLIAETPKVHELLLGAFSGSPYLAAIAQRDPQALADCLLKDPDRHFEEARAELAAAVAEAERSKDVSSLLRRFKQRVALFVGLADLGGVWPIETVIATMSVAADTALEQAVGFLFRQARAAGEIGPAPNGSNVAPGYFVIAMGKLGAFELNYSSDIDIIVFYDAERARLASEIEPNQFFVKITRELVCLMQEHTSDGYVFRTDLRLRPDPGATQIALSTDAGLTYYESFGQNWERAALIKARVVAGDFEAGESFLGELSPFIWRKYLDYPAIADIHAMKRRVHAFKGHDAIAVAGHDIKLGRGGIRDIEFFAQTQQLIAGGRHPELRTRGTLETLRGLADGGWIARDADDDLSRAYLFLRRVENRLQMVDDLQTHVIPSDPPELDRIAALSGYADADGFAEAVFATLSSVEAHYEALFEKVPDLPVPALVFAGDAAEPAALATLERLGFQNPAQAISAVRAWQSGRYAATRSERARECLTQFLPSLLDALGHTADPDSAFATFDKVIADMPAGVQLFSLLAANPSLLRLIADIMGTAPRLATIIGRRPRLLDAVLDPGFFGVVPTPLKLKELVGGALAEATDYQDALDRARIVGREQAFLIGVRVLSGTVSAEQAGASYAALASTLIEELQGCVEAELVRQHGRVEGGRAAVLAMGKLGGGEMTAASDLDLIVVYDFAGEGSKSDGPRSLPGSQYYTRFTQRLISALSAPTAEGALYQVDMRLRPSGTQGPVATKLSSFIDYQHNAAWTWEHLALTRASVLSGPPKLRQEIEGIIVDVLRQTRDRTQVAADMRAMRAKIEEDKGTKDIWDLKHVRGGLIDIEFLTQFLQVISAHEHPDVLDQNTAGALSKLMQAGVITIADAEILVPAVRLYHTVTQVLRLCLDKPFVPEEAPRGLKDLLARASEMPDFATLEAMLKETLCTVRAAFDRLLV